MPSSVITNVSFSWIYWQYQSIRINKIKKILSILISQQVQIYLYFVSKMSHFRSFDQKKEANKKSDEKINKKTIQKVDMQEKRQDVEEQSNDDNIISLISQQTKNEYQQNNESNNTYEFTDEKTTTFDIGKSHTQVSPQEDLQNSPPKDTLIADNKSQQIKEHDDFENLHQNSYEADKHYQLNKGFEQQLKIIRSQSHALHQAIQKKEKQLYQSKNREKQLQKKCHELQKQNQQVIQQNAQSNQSLVNKESQIILLEQKLQELTSKIQNEKRQSRQKLTQFNKKDLKIKKLNTIIETYQLYLHKISEEMSLSDLGKQSRKQQISIIQNSQKIHFNSNANQERIALNLQPLLEEIKKSIQAFNDKIYYLERDHSQISQRMMSLSDQLQKKTEEIYSYADHAETNNNQILSLTGAKSKLDRQLSQLKTRSDEQMKRLERQKQQNASTLNKQIQRINQQYKSNISLLKGQINNFIKENTQLNQNICLFNSQQQNLQIQYENVSKYKHKETQQLKDKLNDLQYSLSRQFQTKKQNLQSKNRKLQQQLQKLYRSIKEKEQNILFISLNNEQKQRILMSNLRKQKEYMLNQMAQIVKIHSDKYNLSLNSIQQIYEHIKLLNQQIDQKNIRIIHLQEINNKYDQSIGSLKTKLIQNQTQLFICQNQLKFNQQLIKQAEENLRQIQISSKKELQSTEDNYKQIIDMIEQNFRSNFKSSAQMHTQISQNGQRNRQLMAELSFLSDKQEGYLKQIHYNGLIQQKSEQIKHLNEIQSKKALNYYKNEKELERQIFQHKKMIKKLQQQVEFKGYKLQSHIKENQKLTERIDTLSTSLANIQAYRQTIYQRIDSTSLLIILSEVDESIQNYNDEHTSSLHDLMRMIAYKQEFYITKIETQSKSKEFNSIQTENQEEKMKKLQSEHRKKANQFRETLTRYEAIIRQCRTKEEKLQLNLRNKDGQISRLRLELEDEKTRLLAKVQKSEQKVAKYKSELDIKNSESQVLLSQAKAMKGYLQEAQNAQHASLKQKHRQLQKQYQNIQKNFSLLQAKIKEMQRQDGQSKRKYQQISVQLMDAELKLQASQRIKKQAHTEIKQLDKYIENMKKENGQLNILLKSRQNERSRPSLSSNQMSQYSMKDKHERQLKQNEKLISQLLQQIDELKSKISKSSSTFISSEKQENYEQKLQEEMYQELKLQFNLLEEENDKIKVKLKKMEEQMRSSQLPRSKSPQRDLKLTNKTQNTSEQDSMIFSIPCILVNKQNRQFLVKMIEEGVKKSIKQTKIYYKFEDYCKGYSLSPVKSECLNESFIFLLKSKDNLFGVFTSKFQTNQKPSALLFSLSNKKIVNRKNKMEINSGIIIDSYGQISIGNGLIKIKSSARQVTVKEITAKYFQPYQKKDIFGKQGFRQDFTLQMQMFQIYRINFK